MNIESKGVDYDKGRPWDWGEQLLIYHNMIDIRWTSASKFDIYNPHLFAIVAVIIIKSF